MPINSARRKRFPFAASVLPAKGTISGIHISFEQYALDDGIGNGLQRGQAPAMPLGLQKPWECHFMTGAAVEA
jgi:hypothetical protein